MQYSQLGVGDRIGRVLWDGDHENETKVRRIEALGESARQVVAAIAKLEIQVTGMSFQQGDGAKDTNKLESSYYFFTSDGKKNPSKWDSFDVQAGLDRVDQQEQDKGSLLSLAPFDATRATKGSLERHVKGLELGCEEILFQLDAIGGSPRVKARRKALVEFINSQALARVDALRKQFDLAI